MESLTGIKKLKVSELNNFFYFYEYMSCVYECQFLTLLVIFQSSLFISFSGVLKKNITCTPPSFARSLTLPYPLKSLTLPHQIPDDPISITLTNDYLAHNCTGLESKHPVSYFVSLPVLLHQALVLLCLSAKRDKRTDQDWATVHPLLMSNYLALVAAESILPQTSLYLGMMMFHMFPLSHILYMYYYTYSLLRAYLRFILLWLHRHPNSGWLVRVTVWRQVPVWFCSTFDIHNDNVDSSHCTPQHWNVTFGQSSGGFRTGKYCHDVQRVSYQKFNSSPAQSLET